MLSDQQIVIEIKRYN